MIIPLFHGPSNSKNLLKIIITLTRKQNKNI